MHTNNMKNRLFNELIYIFLITCFFIFLSFYYANQFNLERHWSSKHDLESVLTYNALLFNSSIEQEFVDHSGYFSILISSLYLKVLGFLGVIDIYKISQIKGLGLDEIFQDAVVHLRILSTVINAFISVAITYFFYLIFKRKFYSFILGVSVFFLYGNIELLTNFRTETFSILFLIFSLIAIKKFFEKNKIIYFISFFFFLFCSILNKNLVILYIPVILFFTYFINENKLSFNISLFNNLDKNKMIFQIFLFLFIFITLKSLVFGRDFRTWVFLIILISMINFYFYKISNKLSLKNNIILFNFSLIIGYIFFNIIVFLHPSASLVSLNKTIFQVITQMVSHATSEIRSTTTLLALLTSLAGLFLENTLRMVDIFILTINKYSFPYFNPYLIIFLSSICLFIVKLKNFNSRDKKILISIFFTFFIINEINFLRGVARYYFGYFDYLIILFLGLILNKFSKSTSLFLASIILVITFYSSHNQVFIKYALPFENKKLLCGLSSQEQKNRPSFLQNYHQLIPESVMKSYCDFD